MWCGKYIQPETERVLVHGLTINLDRFIEFIAFMSTQTTRLLFRTIRGQG